MFLAVLAACGGEGPTAPEVPGVTYQLTRFFYEDVIPNERTITASDGTFVGGPARLVFRADSTGVLDVASTLFVTLHREPDGAESPAVLLQAQYTTFTFAVDDIGVVTFVRGVPWPFDTPTLLTPDSVSQRRLTCYDDPAVCADHVLFEATWTRDSTWMETP